jgi:hypothetical protein
MRDISTAKQDPSFPEDDGSVSALQANGNRARRLRHSENTLQYAFSSYIKSLLWYLKVHTAIQTRKQHRYLYRWENLKSHIILQPA